MKIIIIITISGVNVNWIDNDFKIARIAAVIQITVIEEQVKLSESRLIRENLHNA